jgi:glutaredoxin
MHGLAELREDIRQMCIDKYYPADVWWAYVSYVNANCSLADIGSCWLDAAAAAGIDIDEITTCLNDEGEDLAAAELALNDRYGVRGSPTIFINGERYAGGRSPEDLKQAVCSGFSSPPDECGQMLSTTVATASGSC